MTVVLAAAAVVATLGAWTLVSLQGRRRKSPEELERLRRLDVNRRGRIAPGHIVDLVESEVPPGGARLILYKYDVGGVTYEAAQDVSALSHLARAASGLAGLTTSVKYDPKQPTNSIIACEEWCGFPVDEVTEDAGLSSPEKPEASSTGS